MQIFKFIPKQIELPYIGALYDLSGRVFYFISVANFILMTRVYYYNQSDSLLRDIFGSYFVFMSVCGIFGMVMAAAAYACIVPSHNKYLQEQAVLDGRSPTYEKLCELEKKIDRLEGKL